MLFLVSVHFFSLLLLTTAEESLIRWIIPPAGVQDISTDSMSEVLLFHLYKEIISILFCKFFGLVFFFFVLKLIYFAYISP